MLCKYPEMSARHPKSAVTANQQMSPMCVVLYETIVLFQKLLFLSKSDDSLVGFHFYLLKAFPGSLMDLLLQHLLGYLYSLGEVPLIS